MKLISRFLNFGSSPRVKNDQITQLQSTVTEKSAENEKLRLKLEQLDKQAKDLQVFYLIFAITKILNPNKAQAPVAQ